MGRRWHGINFTKEQYEAVGLESARQWEYFYQINPVKGEDCVIISALGSRGRKDDARKQHIVWEKV